MFFPVFTLLLGFTLLPGEDWLVIASHREAAMGVDRASINRSGSSVSATVLMGTYEPEMAQGSTVQIQYYLSDETFDCAAQSRIEHEVRIYSPNGTLVGTSPPDPDTSIKTGSIYHTVYEALCADDGRLKGGGHASPLDAIRDEAGKRQTAELAEN